jgi:hypothetical protein
MLISPSWWVILPTWDCPGSVKSYGQVSFAKYEKIGPEKVMGTIVVDRVIDLLSLLFAILLALVLQGTVLYDFFKANWQIPSFPKHGLHCHGCFILFLWLVYKFRRIIKRWSLYQKIQHLVEGFGMDCEVFDG